MTNKEAICRLEDIRSTLEQLSFDKNNSKGMNVCDATIDIAISSLKQTDKYKWHDLRKDPNDLPICCGRVMTYSETEYPYYDLSFYNIDGFKSYTTNAYFRNVIARREIEPFEER